MVLFVSKCFEEVFDMTSPNDIISLSGCSSMEPPKTSGETLYHRTAHRLRYQEVVRVRESVGERLLPLIQNLRRLRLHRLGLSGRSARLLRDSRNRGRRRTTATATLGLRSVTHRTTATVTPAQFTGGRGRARRRRGDRRRRRQKLRWRLQRHDSKRSSSETIPAIRTRRQRTTLLTSDTATFTPTRSLRTPRSRRHDVWIHVQTPSQLARCCKARPKLPVWRRSEAACWLRRHQSQGQDLQDPDCESPKVHA